MEMIIGVVIMCYGFNFLPGAPAMMVYAQKWQDWLWLLLPLGFFVVMLKK